MGKDPIFELYSLRLTDFVRSFEWEAILPLAVALRNAIRERKSVFLCGNGGSAANAIHLANDFLYGIAKDNGIAMKVEALPANPSVMTCLSNDIGYSEVFARQLNVKALKGDILVIFSGSGRSANVIRALETGRDLQMQTFAVVGYDGGKCKDLADHAIHFRIDDMQICEDLQAIAGHMLMQWLVANPVLKGN